MPPANPDELYVPLSAFPKEVLVYLENFDWFRAIRAAAVAKPAAAPTEETLRAVASRALVALEGRDKHVLDTLGPSQLVIDLRAALARPAAPTDHISTGTLERAYYAISANVAPHRQETDDALIELRAVLAARNAT